MNVQKICHENKKQVNDFFKEHWGSSEMVISSGIFQCDTIEGFIFEEDKKILGLVTYVIRNDELEVISLDSILEGKGIGSKLMQQVESFAQMNSLQTITLVTTNDNLNALKFYQKRGYKIVAVFPNAVEEARKIKSSIPLIGNHGIPLNDEIQLRKNLF